MHGEEDDLRTKGPSSSECGLGYLNVYASNRAECGFAEAERCFDFASGGPLAKNIAKSMPARPRDEFVEGTLLGGLPGGDLRSLVARCALKTGTTICGAVARDCVVLAADTRSTMGPTVADKHCFKLHKLSPNVWCAGAGVAGDLDHVTWTLAAELSLMTRQLGSLPRVEQCVTRLCHKLFGYRGHIVTALIVGGVNPTGEMSLWYVSPEGYSHSMPYMAMGSGGFFALSELEAHFEPGLEQRAAMEVCADAIQAGVLNDLGSGTGVDCVVIRARDPTSPELHKRYRMPLQGQKLPYTRPRFEPHQTTILKEIVTKTATFQPNEIAAFL